jgi:hypothetical protein
VDPLPPTAPPRLLFQVRHNRPVEATRPSEVLRRPSPGPLFRWVKAVSWVELAIFAVLLVVWLAPGLEHATFYAGLAHGIGFILLALLIWVAVLRHEAPYTLLAATLTPVGPVGSVIAIEWIERRDQDDRAYSSPASELDKSP